MNSKFQHCFQSTWSNAVNEAKKKKAKDAVKPFVHGSDLFKCYFSMLADTFPSNTNGVYNWCIIL
jgi:hypothetical protein